MTPIGKRSPDTKILARCQTLAQKECCNYSKGNCLEREEKCHLISAYPRIHDGALNCDWFLKAVLPQDKELSRIVWHELFREETLYDDIETPAAEEPTLRCCVICRNAFLPVTHNQKYCADCRAIGKRQHDRLWRRKQRNKS